LHLTYSRGRGADDCSDGHTVALDVEVDQNAESQLRGRVRSCERGSGDDWVEHQFGFIRLDALQRVLVLEQDHKSAVGSLEDADARLLTEHRG
jgi:uncharacterized protein HemX